MVFPGLFLFVTLLVYYPIVRRLGHRGVLCAGLVFAVAAAWCRTHVGGSISYWPTFLSCVANAVALPLYLQEIAHIVPLCFTPQEVL